RPISLALVLEAIDRRQGEMAARLTAAAPSFGLFARRLDLLPGELKDLERPLIAQFEDKRFCVLAPHDRRNGLVLDPLSGVREERWKKIDATFTGLAFEIYEEEPKQRPLGRRVRAFFAARSLSVMKLVGLAVAIDGIAVLLNMSIAVLIGT